MGKPRAIPYEDIVRKREEGMKIRDIASYFRCSVGYVTHVLYKVMPTSEGVKKQARNTTRSNFARNAYRKPPEPSPAQYAERNECFRCGARDRKLCGH